MIITDEKRASLKEAYQLIKNGYYSYGYIMKKCNISRIELEALRQGLHYKVKMNLLMSRVSQIQDCMSFDDISIIIRGK